MSPKELSDLNVKEKGRKMAEGRGMGREGGDLGTRTEL